MSKKRFFSKEDLDKLPQSKKTGKNITIDEDGYPQFVVEAILKKRGTGKNAKYLVKWYGFSKNKSTWEPAYNLENAKDLIQLYEKNNCEKMTSKKQKAPKSSKKMITKQELQPEPPKMTQANDNEVKLNDITLTNSEIIIIDPVKFQNQITTVKQNPNLEGKTQTIEHSDQSCKSICNLSSGKLESPSETNCFRQDYDALASNIIRPTDNFNPLSNEIECIGSAIAKFPDGLSQNLVNYYPPYDESSNKPFSIDNFFVPLVRVEPQNDTFKQIHPSSGQFSSKSIPNDINISFLDKRSLENSKEYELFQLRNSNLSIQSIIHANIDGKFNIKNEYLIEKKENHESYDSKPSCPETPGHILSMNLLTEKFEKTKEKGIDEILGTQQCMKFLDTSKLFSKSIALTNETPILRNTDCLEKLGLPIQEVIEARDENYSIILGCNQNLILSNKYSLGIIHNDPNESQVNEGSINKIIDMNSILSRNFAEYDQEYIRRVSNNEFIKSKPNNTTNLESISKDTNDIKLIKKIKWKSNTIPDTPINCEYQVICHNTSKEIANREIWINGEDIIKNHSQLIIDYLWKQYINKASLTDDDSLKQAIICDSTKQA